MILRKSALYALGVTLVIAVVMTWLLRDWTLEHTLEYALGRIFQAPVEIDGLDFDPLHLRADLDAVHVADKDDLQRHLFELGHCAFDIEVLPLLAKKIIVTDMAVTDIAVGTPRRAAAILTPRQTTPGASGNIVEQIKGALPRLDLDALTRELNLDVLIQPDELASVSAVREASQAAQQKTSAWQMRVETSTLSRDIENLQRDVNAVDLDAIDTAEEAQRAVTQLQSLLQRTQTLRDEARATYQTAQSDIKQLAATRTQVQALAAQDFARVKKLAAIGSLDVSDIGKALFGDATLSQYKTFIKYATLARAYFGADEAQSPPPRRAGRYIEFPTTRPVLPRFLLTHAQISGRLAAPAARIEGLLQGLTTEPAVYGQPTTFNFNLAADTGAAWDINGLLDLRGGPGITQLNVSGRRVHLPAVSLGGSSALLPSAIVPGLSDLGVSLRLQGDSLQSNLVLDASDVLFNFAPMPALDTQQAFVATNLRDLFARFDAFHLSAALSGLLQQPRLSLTTNFDRVLSQRLNNLVGERLSEAETTLRGKIDGLVAQNAQGFDQQLDALRALVDGSLGNDVQSVATIEQRVAQKQRDLEAKLRGRLEQDVRKRLEKKLPGLLR